MPVVGLSNSVNSVAIYVHYIIKMSKRAGLHPICCECGHCNVTLYNVDDFISTQIDTQIGYVQSDVYEFSTTVRSILP